jgi:hypothetical protein
MTVCDPFTQVNDILMTVSKESRELEDRVESYVSFMKQYKCVSTKKTSSLIAAVHKKQIFSKN